MIPRQVRRMFDQRGEPRVEPERDTGVMCWRGQCMAVRVVNISTCGAMVMFDRIPHIGERVTLQLLDGGAVAGQVQWVREGRVGINFTDAFTGLRD